MLKRTITFLLLVLPIILVGCSEKIDKYPLDGYVILYYETDEQKEELTELTNDIDELEIFIEKANSKDNKQFNLSEFPALVVIVEKKVKDTYQGLTKPEITEKLENFTIKNTTKEVVVDDFNNKETFLLVLGATYCSWCHKLKKETLPYINNIKVNFIYANQDFTNEELQDFLATYNLTYSASPTSYLIVDGVVRDTVRGYVPVSKLYKFIKRGL